MEIIRLPTGQLAPPEADCISVDTLPDGRFRLNGNALVECGSDAGMESVSLIGGDSYDSYEAAETAGLAWAGDQCVASVYVTRDAPLPE